MIKYIISLLLVSLAFGSHAGVAGNSGCYAVSGQIDQIVINPDLLVGSITGDIVGTISTTGGPREDHGAVVFTSGEQTWIVTGGIVPLPSGTTLIFDIDVTLIFARLPIISVNNTARVVEGARKGNLTLHGWTDLSLDPPKNHLVYHGVICL